MPGACVSSADLPNSCDQVCADQGKQCSEDCDFGTVLPGRAAYFADLASCRANTGLSFVETAKCGDGFDHGNFLPYGAVRCCCADAGFDIATAAEKTPLCDAACKKDPYPPVPDCASTSLSCTELCVGATRGADLDCATCLIGSVMFMPSGCGSRECICGGPRFADPWSACDSACAATRQHQRDVYAAAPRPDPVGRPPAARFDADRALRLLDMTTDDAGHVWVSGATFDGASNSFLTVALFDPDLHQLWKWDDPAKRTLEHASIARLGTQTVVIADVTPGTAPLLFFDASGFVREVPTTLGYPTALSPYKDGVVVRDDAGVVVRTLSELDPSGAVVVTAPDPTMDGFTPYYVHAVGEGGWTLADTVDHGLIWRRVNISATPMGSTASVAWKRQLALPDTASVSLVGAGPAGSDRVLVWGTSVETRGGSNRGFPFIAELVDDGSLGLHWANGDLVTPGPVNAAVRTASGHTCAAGTESWLQSTRDPPTSGVVCSPDGCDALTVRCLDAAGTVLWNYHHRSEASAGLAVAAAPGDRLYVLGTVTRNSRLSTGTHSVLMRFDP
jgi:hypothetical protein